MVRLKRVCGRMNRIVTVYCKYQKIIEKVLFPILLCLYPLTNIRQGIDVSDATYSLANFEFFGTMDGTWMTATYLANVLGSLMMRLPFGNTLMGMYFYTSFIQSVTAVGVYAALRRKIPAIFVFAGEWIAIGLCWCPSTILYNYLTYLFMAAGALFLYYGIIKDKKGYHLAAGICLGMNVAVRMPNVVQAAFIITLWYAAALYKRTLRQTAQDTLWCILGYLIGFGVPFLTICIRYGTGAYPAMVQTMFAMTEKAADYKPASMITSMFADYFTGLYWMMFAAVCMAGGWLLFMIQRRFFSDQRAYVWACRIAYAAVLAVLLRFYWGKGMFHFRYYGYDYGSIYYPAVLLLISAMIAALYCLFTKSVKAEQKVLAVLVLVQTFVTPLGSNNRLYPIINNLFIVVPFLLWIARDRFVNAGNDGIVEKTFTTVWAMPFVGLVLFVFVQSVGFHTNFAFQDGIYGEARDATVSVPAKAAGVYTNQDNAAWLEELARYMQDADLTGREVILYGDIPGLGYLLDMPSALSTFWADLDSYRMAEYQRDMESIISDPVVITASPIAAYLAEDADGMNWFGVDKEKLDADEKLQILATYMKEHSYKEVFGNGRYVVYVTDD